ncbi:MAG: zonular occludens toxin domain-containing protein [Candidatus Woesearchaeota archaeon]
MGKKKSKGVFYYVWMLFYYVGLAVFYVIKYLFKGIFAIFKFGAKKTASAVRKSAEKRAAAKAEKAKPKITAKYVGLKEVKAISGDLKQFEHKLLHSESTIGIILGARGTGKSAIGMRLLENVHASTGRSVFAMGFNPEDLPSWINVVDSIDQISNDSFVLVDEGGITFSSRKSMSNANQLLSSLLLIARHKNISVLFITQNSSNLEVNVLRQADFLILKPSSLLQKDFERKIIKELYESVEPDFDKLEGTKGLTYIHSDSYRGFATNELPSFWSSRVSKAFKEKK